MVSLRDCCIQECTRHKGTNPISKISAPTSSVSPSSTSLASRSNNTMQRRVPELINCPLRIGNRKFSLSGQSKGIEVRRVSDAQSMSVVRRAVCDEN